MGISSFKSITGYKGNHAALSLSQKISHGETKPHLIKQGLRKPISQLKEKRPCFLFLGSKSKGPM